VGEPDELIAEKGSLHPLLEGVTVENNAEGPGVVVSAIGPNTTAAYSGLRPNDLIIGVNKLRVANLKKFSQALTRNKTAILLHINRGGRGIYLVIR